MNEPDFTNHHILYLDYDSFWNGIRVMICEDNRVFVSLDETGGWQGAGHLFFWKEEADALINLLQRVRDNLPSQKEL